MEKESSLCPLCHNSDTTHFYSGENRKYRHCSICDLVFVPSSYFISAEEEKAKYDNHRNTPENAGYVAFLNRLLLPLQSALRPGAKGLDFGSGPGPTLHLLMKKRGYEMAIYDPFYAPDNTVFDQKYDFITSTEVIEHLYDPMAELERLWHCLERGGILGLMTAFRVKDFAGWYYKRDLTHIRFFTPKTFGWIAERLDARLKIPRSGVILLHKK